MKHYSALHQPLFSLFRGVAEEISVLGEICVVDEEKVIFHTGELIGEYPARSCLKPFQFLATGIAKEKWSGAQAHPRYIACVGSISANAHQVEKLREWYQGPEAEERMKKLRCGMSFPMDEVNRGVLKSQNQGPSPIYHNCFSKHMAIIEACDQNNWNYEYTSPDHPYQKRLIASMASLLRVTEPAWESVVDGCTLPTPILSLKDFATLYQRLAAHSGEDRLAAIRNLMVENPEWIGGPERVDTRVMKDNPGKIVAKEGADGLLTMGLLPTAKYPKGLGIALKLASGINPIWTALAIAPLLESLGLKSSAKVPAGQLVHYCYTPFKATETKVMDISPVVDDAIAVWPGDAPFKRVVTLDTFKGDHLTLSSIEGTVHVGAHTDAPNHYDKSEIGIDKVDVRKYMGVCQVIEVKKAKGQRLEASDIENVEIRAPRVILKTGSYPNAKKFNEDFNALSKSIVELLAGKGVILVGIDTPSIDAFDSKDLPAHLATVKTHMSILEGINLEGVPSGIYDLYAVPLRLGNADASPVRALLFARH